MPAQFDPILYSDWDAIQSIVYAQLGPLQEFAGSPGVYVEGTGYGLPTSSLSSRPYPFSRNITQITSEAQAQVTFDSAHHLVTGEVIFFTSFSNSWGGLSIANNFATVNSVLDSTRVIIDFSTFGFTPWQIGDTAEAVQYYISANQFVNLRADLAKVVQHITGAPPGPGNFLPGGEATDLATPVRGDIIYHSVFDPYYNISNSVDAYKFINNEFTTVQPSLPGSAINTGAWNGVSDFEIGITWSGSDGYDFVQYFNTGGLLKLDMINLDASVVGNANNDNVFNLNRHWRDLLKKVFPLWVGAKGKTQMGLAADPRNISTSGAFDAIGVYSSIFQVSGTAVTAYGSAYDDHSVNVEMKQTVNQKNLFFRITLTDTSTTNAYAQSVDIDRNFELSFRYSVGSVPLASAPSNYTISITNGW